MHKEEEQPRKDLLYKGQMHLQTVFAFLLGSRKTTKCHFFVRFELGDRLFVDGQITQWGRIRRTGRQSNLSDWRMMRGPQQEDAVTSHPFILLISSFS